MNYFSGTFVGEFCRQALPQSPEDTTETSLSHQGNEARVGRKHRASKRRGERGDGVQSDDPETEALLIAVL